MNPSDNQIDTAKQRPPRPLAGVSLILLLLLALAPGTRWPGLSAQGRPDPNAVKPIPKRPKPKAEDSESADAAAGTAEEAKPKMSEQMERLFPIGRPFSGVRFPSYTGDSLTSVVEAEVMRRIDKERLDLEQLVITSYAEGEKPDTKIFMDRAIYEMPPIDKLTSNSPTRIVQPQFEMTGDSMTFDNKTQVAHMVGNVRMRIFQVDNVFSGGMLGGTGEDEEE